MKQFVLFTYIVLTSLLFGCESETISSPTSNVVGTISTRVSNDITSLPANSQALLHTSSGTSIFTFDGNHWNGDQSIFSFSSTTPNVLTALYPAYNGEKSITENPYTNNELEDVLIAQSTYTNGQNIELTFKHLFSTLTIHILPPLKESITRISLEIPQIETLNADGSFSLSGTHQNIPELNPEGNYTFIIPPKDNCTLTLHLTIGEETISHSITHSFKSGYKYECNVKEPGIYNAEDLIEFSKVINGESSKKKWSDFGYINDNDTIYRLLNDIDMDDIDCPNFTPIGNYYKRPFSAIFEGNNHTISGLNIIPSDGTLGLFGRITPTGIVKEVHLYNCSTLTTNNDETGKGIGLLVGLCYGTIINSSITKGKISITATSPTGGLIGDARSGCEIINCYVKESNISSQGYTGGIAGSVNNGNIINCFSSLNTITCTSAKCGGFIGYATQSNIINCYKYNLSFTSTTDAGQIIGKGENSSIEHCFSDSRSPLLINEESGNCNKEPMYYYNAETDNIFTIVCQRLNQWVNNQSSTIYTLWVSKNNLPPTFITEQ